VATFHDPKALAVHQRKRAEKVRRSLAIAGQSMVNDMKQEALRLTSGTVSSETLAAMGHPYARRRTTTRRRGGQRGSLPRLPIHRQSGELQKSLRVFKRMNARGITWQLQFTSPHAVVLNPGGTSKMVARGFWAAMKQHYNQKAKRRMLQAYRMAHK
jgi:hypothetical protein